MTSSEYVEKFKVAVKCEATRKRYSDTNKHNGDWISRAKIAGDDLVEYRLKMGAAVSEAIMSDPDERVRRAQQTATNNKTPEAREKSRVTAIKTSARPEILQARTLRLQSSYKPSKPERVLSTFLTPLGFRWNCLISDSSFSKKTHRRQIDFTNHEMKTLIEFDGAHHFMTAWKRMPLEDIQKNDLELDAWAVKNGYMLLRIGYTQFKTKTGVILCEQKLLERLNQFSVGVHCFGAEYGDRNLLVSTEVAQ